MSKIVERNGVSNTNQSTKGSSRILVTDFGERSVHDQNFSKIVALPKVALANCGDVSRVNIKLVQENGTKYLKLTPVHMGGRKN
jgi:hypothetical protein